MDSITASSWTREQWAAVWLWLYERVVPLAIEDDNGQGIQGCGQLLTIGSGTYLVTAAHVFKNIDPADIGIPVSPYSTHFTRLGTGSMVSRPAAGFTCFRATAKTSLSVSLRSRVRGNRFLTIPSSMARSSPMTSTAGHRSTSG